MAPLARPPLPLPLSAPMPGRADPGAMTAEQFATLVARLQWNNAAVARALACSETLIRKWNDGRLPVPPRVAYWLWSLADVMRLHPPPAEWRTVRPPGPRPNRNRKGKSRAEDRENSI